MFRIFSNKIILLYNIFNQINEKEVILILALLSPAKTLDLTKVKLDIETSKPRFINEAETIMHDLKELEVHDLCSLMKISEDLGVNTFTKIQDWNTIYYGDEKPFVLSFKGEAYRGLNADDFTKDELEFCNESLRILSGLYGILKPLDGTKAYRLEMGTKISISGSKNLYDFWGDKIIEAILEDLENHDERVIINLASNEYYKSVREIEKKVRVITPVFKERKGFKYKVVTVYAKKARGEMVRYITQNNITKSEDLKNFDLDGYEFNKELSEGDTWVFTRG